MSSGFKKTFELVFECDIYVVVNKAKSFMSLSIINILKYSKSLKKHNFTNNINVFLYIGKLYASYVTLSSSA